jgi:hypothetical protein
MKPHWNELRFRDIAHNTEGEEVVIKEIEESESILKNGHFRTEERNE